MIELKYGYNIEGQPTQARYKKKKNGLYEVNIEPYIVVTPTGEKYSAMLRFPNCSFNADKDEGVILLDNNDLKQFNPIVSEDDEEKTIFDLIIPDIKDGE